MERLNLNLEDLKKEIRADELRTTIASYFWNEFEIEILGSTEDFSYDLEFVKTVLKASLSEMEIVNVMLFLNILRYELLNNFSIERILNAFISFQAEARLLSDAFKKWYQS